MSPSIADAPIIAVLAGDGIGPEIMREALRVLREISSLTHRPFQITEALIGGAAYDKYGVHFPEETKKICESAQAILFGSVGGPISGQHLDKWRGCEANALLGLRKTFGFAINLRPAKVYPDLRTICPLKDEIIGNGVDILIIRELLGDIYFGEHSRFEAAGEKGARDVAVYTEDQIATVAHFAFKSAQTRRKKVTSVDKANVLETGKLWREVVTKIAAHYPEVTLEHMLVDNCAMQLIKAPTHFDVLLCPNMFGDILSDEAAVLPGSLGLTPSASLSKSGFGMYEPSGGSAPDIAGQGIANPTAQILSLAMLLRHSFHLEQEALALETAVSNSFKAGARTKDIYTSGAAGVGTKLVSTSQFTDKVLEELRKVLA